MDMIFILKAIVIGIVEGITEFITSIFHRTYDISWMGNWF